VAQVEKKCRVFDLWLAHAGVGLERAALEQLFETVPKDLLS